MNKIETEGGFEANRVKVVKDLDYMEDLMGYISQLF